MHASFAGYVSREMGKAEALLKVVGSRPENLVDNFFTLMPSGSPADFQRILELKARPQYHGEPVLKEQMAHLENLHAPLPACLPLREPTKQGAMTARLSSSAGYTVHGILSTQSRGVRTGDAAQ